MDERFECCRYEPSLEDLLADEVMTPVLRSAGLEAQEFREMMVETARRIEDRARRAGQGLGARGRSLRRQSRELQPDPQPGPVVLQRDRAVVPPRNGAHEAQSKAVSGSRAARFEANKAVQYALPIRLRNARSLIRYFEDRLPVLVEHPQLDLAAAGIFQRVVE